jgi:Phosphosulfolactate phosphohydrolase and related enzymes
MHIEVYGRYSDANEPRLRERSVVVIDVLRATTTMVEAMANGANNVIPVCEIEEAIALYRARGEQSVLAGERKGMPIEGFELGNSPQDFTSAKVQGKTIILTTTNGTAALHAVRNSSPIFIGCLRNRKALVKRLMEEERDVSIVCAGTDKQFSADDYYCAGAIVQGLMDEGAEMDRNMEMEDAAQIAQLFYRTAKEDENLLMQTKHIKAMFELGLMIDYMFCMEEDVCNFVPQMMNSTVEL